MSKPNVVSKGECIVNVISLHEFVSMQTKHLLGQILTTVDASITEENQNKAVKDIVKVYVYQHLSEIEECMSSIYGAPVTGPSSMNHLN